MTDFDPGSPEGDRTVTRALITCPWCDWRRSLSGPDFDEVVAVGRRMIDAHNAEAGHRVIPGRAPRIGYYRGKPIS